MKKSIPSPPSKTGISTRIFSWPRVFELRNERLTAETQRARRIKDNMAFLGVLCVSAVSSSLLRGRRFCAAQRRGRYFGASVDVLGHHLGGALALMVEQQIDDQRVLDEGEILGVL